MRAWQSLPGSAVPATPPIDFHVVLKMKEVHVTIDPVMDAEFLKTLRLFGTRTCIRYSMEPIKL